MDSAALMVELEAARVVLVRFAGVVMREAGSSDEREQMLADATRAIEAVDTTLAWLLRFRDGEVRQ